jgi:hypothetical protein
VYDLGENINTKEMWLENPGGAGENELGKWSLRPRVMEM